MTLAIGWQLPAALAVILFLLGLLGLLARRNLIFILISIEIMLNAAGLLVIVAGMRWRIADGQVMFIFILNLAGAELALGLILLLRLRARFPQLDGDSLNLLRDVL